MYTRMLVPLDGSEYAEVVFPYVKELAGRLDIDVILLHVFASEASEFAPMHRAYIEQAAEMVKREARKVQRKSGASPQVKPVEVRGEMVVGSPAEEILRFAEENKADFILTATHGRTGLRHWALGKVADKILRVAKVPVCLVRAGVPDQVPYDRWPKKTILVPLDGSELAESVLPHVERLARQRDQVEVVLLRVCEPLVTPSYYAAELSGVPLNWGEYMQKETARSKQAAKEYLAGIEKRFRESNIDVRSEVLVGKAADEIIDYVKKNPLSLIVMASHGRSGLSRLVYGSTAESVLFGVASPLCLVKLR